MINDVKWIPINSLKSNPKNNNKHTPDQIKRLAEIIKYQGIRSPIIVSNRSDFITKGHATLEACREAGLTTVPVSYQDYTDAEQEYLHMTSDNAIAEWAGIDMDAVYKEVEALEVFDTDLLGFKEFGVKEFTEPDEKKEPTDKEGELNTCPNCGILISG